MAKYPFTQGSSFPQRWHQTDDCEDQPGCSGQHHPLSKYWKFFPHKVDDSRYPKPGSLCPTSHTWMSNDGSPMPFPGHFITEVQHATQPRSHPTCFYIFKDATSLQILLSYATSERLGILEFKVPNLVATSCIDDLSVISSPTPCSLRKTAKCVTFHGPLVDPVQPCSSTPLPQGLSGKRKTASLEVCFGHNRHIKGTEHKNSQPDLQSLYPNQPLYTIHPLRLTFP